MTPGTRRAPRKDAQRNRERILEAAREVVAEQGVAAKMEQVASRAGVGIGTLYRFVPTKDALFSTILGEQADRLADLAERALALPQGESAFHTWMTEAAAWQSSNKAFINVLAARDPADPVPKLLSSKLRALLRDLVRRGQADGDLRDDVTSSDVLMVLLAVGRRWRPQRPPRSMLSQQGAPLPCAEALTTLCRCSWYSQPHAQWFANTCILPSGAPNSTT